MIQLRIIEFCKMAYEMVGGIRSTCKGDAVSDFHMASLTNLMELSQLCSYSRTYHQFMESEGSLTCSQELTPSPYHEPDQSSQYYSIVFV